MKENRQENADKIIIAYVPVLHEGYRTFFEKHKDVKSLYIFGEEVCTSYEHLIKDIRKLSPDLVCKAIRSWGIFERVEILDFKKIEELKKSNNTFIVSNDDLTTALIGTHFKDITGSIEVDTIFLRWDKKTSIESLAVSPDVTVSESDFDKKMMTLVQEEGLKAKDWWRRLGAIAVKEGKVIIKIHNQYVPSDQIAYDQGDPRSNFKSGVHIESSLALHAEAGLVAQAAKEGISLKGVDVYSEAFPCPPCAKQLAYAGIKRLFYRVGYKVLDGESILRSQGVEIVFVGKDK